MLLFVLLIVVETPVFVLLIVDNDDELFVSLMPFVLLIVVATRVFVLLIVDNDDNDDDDLFVLSVVVDASF